MKVITRYEITRHNLERRPAQSVGWATVVTAYGETEREAMEDAFDLLSALDWDAESNEGLLQEYAKASTARAPDHLLWSLSLAVA